MQYLPRVKFIIHHSSFIILIMCLAACARQGAPAGGPKDTKPPGIDTLASTPNFSTRFDKKRIQLKFDEWVVLSDVGTQIVVSPPLAERYEVLLKGRTVVVNFDKDEVFRPNTTYTLNFGTAVKDLHEGNPAKDLRFVFSTGDFIDSLSFRGVINDAFSGEPVENVSVMLYENFADSAVRKERPYYFSRTDKTGQYEFKNLRSGTFRVVAIEEIDNNLKWDGEAERIAMLDSALVLTDSLRGSVNLKLFKNQPKFRLVGQNTNRYGMVKLGFSVPLNDFETQTIAPPGLRTLLEKTSDSLILWYDLPSVDSAWALLFSATALRNQDSVLQGAGSKFDTIVVKKLSRSAFLTSHPIIFGDDAPPATKTGRGKTIGAPPKPNAVKTIVQSPILPARLPFNVPIVAYDTARWFLTVDSSRLTAFTVRSDSTSTRRFSVAFDWKQGKTYTLMLLPGALTDFWGTPNADTLIRNFNVPTDKQLGTLALTLEKIRPGTGYVLQLLNGATLEEERSFIAESTSKKLVFNQLQVAAYNARLIEDLNQNGRWDTGDFTTQRQPERIFNKKLDPLRANWELEVSFSTESISEKKKKQ
ncbi:MAG: Ig-like domain-containing protein [Saprospiraceae bacterium]|nr:Ig-like domain-containing protein [Saprospiraceae bacterium]